MDIDINRTVTVHNDAAGAGLHDRHSSSGFKVQGSFIDDHDSPNTYVDLAIIFNLISSHQ